MSETVLIPLFKEVFGYVDLINLNSESNNFPGIDLGDRKRKIAFQISSTTDLEKIKHTLRQFVDSKHYEVFSDLFVYCISEKAPINIGKDFSEFTEENFSFTSKNILDFRDLLKAINAITDYEKIQRIESLLNKQFSEIKLEKYGEALQSSLLETTYTNLLKISFPTKLYTARIEIKKKDVKRKKIFNDRDLIFQYKKENDLKFSSDWIDHEKQLYSFHDLSNRYHDISKVIDLGTVETMTPEEFYEESNDHERAFKALLKYCFAKQAFFLGIEFRHIENLFVFKCEDEKVITRYETWNSGKRSATRGVIKVKTNTKTNSVWYFTHLAFSISLKLYSNEWYLEVSPDWFITQDGFVKHSVQDEKVTSWLKRNERNLHVLNNTRFIANYLKNGKSQSSLFQENVRRPKNFIEFSNYVSFKNSPRLTEEEWTSNESDEAMKLMKDEEGNVDTEL